MRIKRYIVDSLPQAIQQIRQELGEDAVILNTKELKTGGFLGFFQASRLEVIAAVPASEKRTEGAKTEQPQDKEAQENVVLKKLHHMEELLKNFTKGQPQTVNSIPTKLQKWIDRLEDQEVDREVIQYIVKQLNSKSSNLERQSDKKLETALMNIIVKMFQDGIAEEALDSSVRMVTLVGPTGVGKTTTIAKLASRQVLYQRNKVGLLTADTFRIAAVEQLKTYANILNIPIEVVESPEHLDQSMDKLKKCQMIFMDSAGRNYLEEQYIEEINSYLSQQLTQENHLVLSMTSRWKDMKQIVEKMKSVQIDKVILTKWDESTCFGAALNLIYHYPYPLSFLSMGQGVPEDIMAAEPHFLAKKILGVDQDETRSSTKAEGIISKF